LNAKQHAKEAEIVAQAGRPSMVTIATNMAGRGTDIVLGGNIEKLIKFVENDKILTDEEKVVRATALRSDWQIVNQQVKDLGGLRIIATERHESRRIDNQLRGRSGRQGDPGSSRFFLSLDDSLMRIFAGEKVKAIMDRLKMPEGEAIEAGMVTRSIESAQRKVEARNFDIRKQLLEYDDVSNDQRKVIYQQRNAILDANSLLVQLDSLREGCFEDLTRTFVPLESVEEQWDLSRLEDSLRDEWHVQVPLCEAVKTAEAMDDLGIISMVVTAANSAFNNKIEKIGENNLTQFGRMVLLQNLDSHWREHLSALDHLRQGIHLRGYAQKQPKQEYKREAFELFGHMLDAVRNEVTRILMTVKVEAPEQLDEVAHEIERKAENIGNITYSSQNEPENVLVAELNGKDFSAVDGQRSLGFPKLARNEPCFCGSGKKYKLCHGKLT
jgi:preprotein translocase subunit SecA